MSNHWYHCYYKQIINIMHHSNSDNARNSYVHVRRITLSLVHECAERIITLSPARECAERRHTLSLVHECAGRITTLSPAHEYAERIHTLSMAHESVALSPVRALITVSHI